jgi:hypothetical protein
MYNPTLGSKFFVHIGLNSDLDEFIQRQAHKAGYRWFHDDLIVNPRGAKTYGKDYALYFDNKDKTILYGRSQDSPSSYVQYTIEQALEAFKSKFFERFILNEKYTAEVSQDGVTVGCQTFDLEKIIQLGELAKKAKKSKV